MKNQDFKKYQDYTHIIKVLTWLKNPVPITIHERISLMCFLFQSMSTALKTANFSLEQCSISGRITKLRAAGQVQARLGTFR